MIQEELNEFLSSIDEEVKRICPKFMSPHDLRINVHHAPPPVMSVTFDFVLSQSDFLKLNLPTEIRALEVVK